MITNLKNEILSVDISSLGAEAVDVRRTDLDCAYLWGGDATYWGSHAPVLFPMICAAVNGQITVDGQKYPLGNHGFARKMEFELVDVTETRAEYRLAAHEKSLAMYPYHFQLTVVYTVVENRLETEYIVQNTDSREIHFQIGTHPGFNCPLESGASFEDYHLSFELPENLEREFLNAANVRIPGKSVSMGTGVTALPLSHDLFAEGALVFGQFKSSQVTLKSDRFARQVTVRFENMHQMGFWQPKGAPFICIEPWRGLAEPDGYAGEFKDKTAVVHLPQGQRFACKLIIEAD